MQTQNKMEPVGLIIHRTFEVSSLTKAEEEAKAHIIAKTAIVPGASGGLASARGTYKAAALLQGRQDKVEMEMDNGDYASSGRAI